MMFEIFCLYGVYSANAVKCGLSISAFVLFAIAAVAGDTGEPRVAKISIILSAVCLALAVLSPSEETYKAWLEIARRP